MFVRCRWMDGWMDGYFLIVGREGQEELCAENNYLFSDT
jgi:hypothetical protein